MAILTGFPPSNTISPSVRISEVDLTLLSPTTTFHRIGLVGFASKGPINTPTSVTSLTDLATKFGNPHPDQGDPYLIYAAQQALQVSNDVVIVRVADVDPTSGSQATTASVEIPAAGGLVDIIGSATGPNYTFAVDSYFAWKLNGVLASKTLVVAAATYTLTALVTELNDQLTALVDGIEFYATSSNTLGLRSTWAFGTSASIELVSIQDSIYGGASSIVGMGTSMTVAELLGTADRYPDDIYTSAGVWNFSGISMTTMETALQVVVSGTGNVNVDDVVQVVNLDALAGGTYTTAQVVAEINNQISSLPGGFLAVAVGDYIQLETVAFGRDSKLLVKADSTLDVVLGLANTQKTGTSPTVASGGGSTDTGGIITGSANSSSLVSLTVYADSPGLEGNHTQVIFTNDTTNGSFTVKVFNNGASVESWGNLTKNQDSTFYAPTYVNANSNYIRIVDNTATSAPPANTAATGLSLTGGKDGLPVDPDDQDDLVIGNPVAGTGLYNLSEPEQIDIDLIAAPGRSSTAVIRALISVAEVYRQDCLAIVDPPFGLTVREIIDWQNGVHPLNSDRFDSDFAALYWPWLQITDTYNNIPVWVPPSGTVLATICYSDNLSAVWFAPAGLTRGVTQGVANVYSRPTLAERDQMYGNQNAINPIISYPDIAGFVIWGQKTLQRAPTALDRVNVRRMMFFIEKSIKNIARALLFEPNTEALRSTFVSACTSILSEVQQGQGLTDFVIKCDEELNPPDVIDRNELRARIGVVPTRAVEFIFIEFSLNRTGTSLG